MPIGQRILNGRNSSEEICNVLLTRTSNGFPVDSAGCAAVSDGLNPTPSRSIFLKPELH